MSSSGDYHKSTEFKDACAVMNASAKGLSDMAPIFINAHSLDLRNIPKTPNFSSIHVLSVIWMLSSALKTPKSAVFDHEIIKTALRVLGEQCIVPLASNLVRCLSAS